jgi:hypothetical protein
MREADMEYSVIACLPVFDAFFSAGNSMSGVHVRQILKRMVSSNLIHILCQTTVICKANSSSLI